MNRARYLHIRASVRANGKTGLRFCQPVATPGEALIFDQLANQREDWLAYRQRCDRPNAEPFRNRMTRALMTMSEEQFWRIGQRFAKP